MQDSNGWLVFADPFHFQGEQAQPMERRLAQRTHSEVWQVGNTMSNELRFTKLHVYEDGGVALSVGGGVALRSVISQGCTPIGGMDHHACRAQRDS